MFVSERKRVERESERERQRERERERKRERERDRSTTTTRSDNRKNRHGSSHPRQVAPAAAFASCCRLEAAPHPARSDPPRRPSVHLKLD